MGMIQTFLYKVPEDKTIEIFQDFVKSKMEENLKNNGEVYESVRSFAVPVVDFDQLWYDQENLKNTPETKEKYRDLANTNRLIAVEIDW
jgi:hypothetical protein